MTDLPVPTVAAIRETAALIGPYVERTPVTAWPGPGLGERLAAGTRVFAKLEFLQRSGTFKVRGALSNILRLDAGQRARGVTAMSAGNHAVAVAYAASVCGVDAKVVMQKSANPARVAQARGYGAEILFADDGATGFALAEKIVADEGRAFVPPFDGPATALGTATLGLEFHEQAAELEVLIVAVGGGGLAGGVAAATKLVNPDCRVIGVEPDGADTMRRSMAAGSAQSIDRPLSIADSLAPPMTLPYPYRLCRDHVDTLLTITDDDLRAAMQLLFADLKIAVEPACAASTAALLQVADDVAGRRVGLVLSGSNIDFPSFAEYAFDTGGQRE